MPRSPWVAGSAFSDARELGRPGRCGRRRRGAAGIAPGIGVPAARRRGVARAAARPSSGWPGKRCSRSTSTARASSSSDCCAKKSTCSSSVRQLVAGARSAAGAGARGAASQQPRRLGARRDRASAPARRPARRRRRPSASSCAASVASSAAASRAARAGPARAASRSRALAVLRLEREDPAQVIDGPLDQAVLHEHVGLRQDARHVARAASGPRRRTPDARHPRQHPRARSRTIRSIAARTRRGSGRAPLVTTDGRSCPAGALGGGSERAPPPRRATAPSAPPARASPRRWDRAPAPPAPRRRASSSRAPRRGSRPARARPRSPCADRAAPAPPPSSVTFCGSRGAAFSAALQLGQRQPRVLARDVGRRQLARDREVVRAVEQQALGDAHELVGAPLRLQLHRRPAPNSWTASSVRAGLRRRLGQPDARDDVVRVQLDDLAQRRQRVGRPRPTAAARRPPAPARAARPPPSPAAGRPRPARSRTCGSPGVSLRTLL